jgi:BolA protein
LAEELQNGVHALALHTYSLGEWQVRHQQAPESPACMGGSKHDHARESGMFNAGK